jgi:glycine cleavage system H protein
MDPKALKYTRNHAWCLIEGDIITLGLTPHAAGKLKDIVFVEIPDPGDDILTDEPIGEVECSDKVLHLFSPADGVAHDVNLRLTDDPDLLVEDPLGAGWIVKVKVSDRAPLEDLLSFDQYESLAKAE